MATGPTLNCSPHLPDVIRSLGVDADEEGALRRIVQAALREVPGSEFGGISELTEDAIRTRAASHPHVESIDQAQYDTGQGPCLTAAYSALPVLVCNELSRDSRWPRFGRAVAVLDVESLVSFRLFDVKGTVGVLNLYARRPNAFDADSRETGSLLAAHAGVVLTATRKQANLGVALESRDVIGQAKGILMERFKISEQQAFETLIAVSQHTHRKLRDVADDLRTNGELAGLE